MGNALSRKLKRILSDHGCTFVRYGKGDHEIWYSPITKATFSVDAGTKKRFTAKGVLKQAGIDEQI